ncbi:hypothetical protein [Vibrio sp.]|uniref:hypothetical protein n=1 Tax=Vibrio sp. TaxID=678 RepID=UPI003AA9A180
MKKGNEAVEKKKPSRCKEATSRYKKNNEPLLSVSQRLRNKQQAVAKCQSMVAK